MEKNQREAVFKSAMSKLTELNAQVEWFFKTGAFLSLPHQIEFQTSEIALKKAFDLCCLLDGSQMLEPAYLIFLEILDLAIENLEKTYLDMGDEKRIPIVNVLAIINIGMFVFKFNKYSKGKEPRSFASRLLAIAEKIGYQDNLDFLRKVMNIL